METHQFYSDLFAEMCHLRIEGQLCDVHLNVEGVIIPAHRIILAALSPYFKAMFCSHLDERQQFTISIQDLNPQIVASIVEFAYTAKLELCEETVQNLMQTAAMMQISPIEKLCSQFIMKHLHPSNCLGIRDFANSIESFDLKEEADKFCEENFFEVSQNEEFLNLKVDQVIGFIARDSLKVAKEEEVYAAVMRWVEHDPERKKKDVVRIMEHVRLPLVQWDFLIKEVSQEKIFVTNEECRNYLQQARAFQASSFHPDLINFAFNEAVLRSHPRDSFSSTDRLYSIGGESMNREILSTVESFNPFTCQASQLAPLPEAKRSLSVAVLDNILYAIGGATDWSSSRSVHAYDIEKQRWQTRGQLCVARSSVVAAVVGGSILCLGGYGENEVLSSVEKYDAELNSWSMVSEMLEARSMAAAAVLDHRLYICGGYNGHIDLPFCHVLDTKTKQWAECANLLEARSMHGAASFQGKIYVVGGCHENLCLRSTEVLDPTLNQWTFLNPMPGPRRGIGFSVIRNALYAAGGHDGTDFQGEIIKFNVYSGEWSVVGNLISSRARFGFL